MTADKNLAPITKYQDSRANDQRAASIYARRREIDQKHADMKLERELKEWQ